MDFPKILASIEALVGIAKSTAPPEAHAEIDDAASEAASAVMEVQQGAIQAVSEAKAAPAAPAETSMISTLETDAEETFESLATKALTPMFGSAAPVAAKLFVQGGEEMIKSKFAIA